MSELPSTEPIGGNTDHRDLGIEASDAQRYSGCLGGRIAGAGAVEDASLIKTLIGTWAGPRWSETLVPQYAATVDRQLDFGPMTLRFDLDRGVITGVAWLQPASVDSTGKAWVYPPREVPLTELEITDRGISFKIVEESRWLRYKMRLQDDPATAELILLSTWMRGHGELTRRPMSSTTVRRVNRGDAR